MEKPKDYHISSLREKSSIYSTVNLFLQHYFHQTLSEIWVLPWLHVSTWLILFSGLLFPFQFSLLGPQQSFHHSNANQVCLLIYTFTKYILESSFTENFWVRNGEKREIISLFTLGSILGNHYLIMESNWNPNESQVAELLCSILRVNSLFLFGLSKLKFGLKFWNRSQK